jgi:calcineurin-like phosphoesterase family protein
VNVSILRFHRLHGYLCLQSVYDKHLGVEFQSEIRTLARVEHLNLVKFYGYLEHEDERIVLVEYVANGTLREHLDCEFFATSLYACVCVYVHAHGC